MSERMSWCCSANSELGQALLQWSNTFSIGNSIDSYTDLVDGLILWAILRDIDPDYFSGDLPETDSKYHQEWIAKWQNIKHVHRMVISYIRDVCDELPMISQILRPDLEQIATNGAEDEIVKLLQAVFLAALFSEKSNQRMVSVIGQLGARVGKIFMQTIRDIRELDARLSTYETDFKCGTDYEKWDGANLARLSPISRDQALESEAKLLEALKVSKALEEEVSNTRHELIILRESHDKLELELETAREELTHRHKASEEEVVESLKARYGKDHETIAMLEQQLYDAQKVIAQQARQLEKVSNDNRQIQDLKDEILLLKSERDELAGNAKAYDNLKKKIRTLQDLEKKYIQTRKELQEANEKVRELEQLRKQCAMLEKASEEHAEAIANGELEIVNQKRARQRLEVELEQLKKQYQQETELRNRQDDTVKDLEERLREIELGCVRAESSLDNELARVVEMEREPAAGAIPHSNGSVSVHTNEAIALSATASSECSKKASLTELLTKENEFLKEKISMLEKHQLSLMEMNQEFQNRIASSNASSLDSKKSKKSDKLQSNRDCDNTKITYSNPANGPHGSNTDSPSDDSPLKNALSYDFITQEIRMLTSWTFSLVNQMNLRSMKPAPQSLMSRQRAAIAEGY